MGRRIVLFLAGLSVAACVPTYEFGPPGGGDGAPDAPETGPAPSDAAPPPVDAFVHDAAPPVDASTTGLGVIHCNQGGGVAPCPIATQGCCAVFANVSDFCVDLATADASCQYPDAAVALVQCDEPAQCTGGQVCCAVGLTFDAMGAHYTAVQCMDPASCTAAAGGVECGNQQVGMFQSACPGAQSCTMVPDDYYFCK